MLINPNNQMYMDQNMAGHTNKMVIHDFILGYIIHEKYLLKFFLFFTDRKIYHQV